MQPPLHGICVCVRACMCVLQKNTARTNLDLPRMSLFPLFHGQTSDIKEWVCVWGVY